MCEVFTADTILKQTEEDCRYLCTGDGILRLYFAIPVTNNVSKVVSVVQTQCVIIRNFYCRLGLGTMSAATAATSGAARGRLRLPLCRAVLCPPR